MRNAVAATAARIARTIHALHAIADHIADDATLLSPRVKRLRNRLNKQLAAGSSAALVTGATLTAVLARGIARHQQQGETWCKQRINPDRLRISL